MKLHAAILQPYLQHCGHNNSNHLSPSHATSHLLPHGVASSGRSLLDVISHFAQQHEKIKYNNQFGVYLVATAPAVAINACHTGQSLNGSPCYMKIYSSVID